MRPFKFAAPLVCALVLFTSFPGVVVTADAASIDYGSFGPDHPTGETAYIDVTESSGTDTVPLFGAPSLSSDTLDFDPAGFVAWATNGASDITNGQLNFTLDMFHGAGITSLLLTEAGDYTLFGAGTPATSVAAGVSIDIDILEVDHVALASPISVFASQSIVRDLITDGPVMLAPWSSGLLVEFGPVLVANNIQFDQGVTRAEVVIDDELLATSEALSVALLAKKDFRISPGVVVGEAAPEPASLGLLVLGGLAIFRRR